MPAELQGLLTQKVVIRVTLVPALYLARPGKLRVAQIAACSGITIRGCDVVPHVTHILHNKLGNFTYIGDHVATRF